MPALRPLINASSDPINDRIIEFHRALRSAVELADIEQDKMPLSVTASNGSVASESRSDND
ncbi:MAG TPA: hypothetical protein QF555_02540 [Candidatus Thalassarchaeaceae archaeon]|nr:hypothetical protein [Candidatus Thalassarchaeaceae archaeon]